MMCPHICMYVTLYVREREFMCTYTHMQLNNMISFFHSSENFKWKTYQNFLGPVC